MSIGLEVSVVMLIFAVLLISGALNKICLNVLLTAATVTFTAWIMLSNSKSHNYLESRSSDWSKFKLLKPSGVNLAAWDSKPSILSLWRCAIRRRAWWIVLAAVL